MRNERVYCGILSGVARISSASCRNRVRDLVGCRYCSDCADWLACFRTKPDVPALLGMGLIVAGVVVINLFSQSEP